MLHLITKLQAANLIINFLFYLVLTIKESPITDFATIIPEGIFNHLICTISYQTATLIINFLFIDIETANKELPTTADAVIIEDKSPKGSYIFLHRFRHLCLKI